MPIRYGIVSTASIVPRFVAGVQASQTGEVVAIASRSLSKAQEVATTLGIPKAYGSYEELYADPTVDVIYVATYNKGHYPVAKAALFAGKHVLVEKPFALTLDEAEELFAIAKEKKRFLMEAQKAVFLPITQKIKALLEEGVIGPVHYVRAFMTYSNVEKITWFSSLESGGGALYGSGSYPLEYLQYLFNSPIAEVAGTAVMSKGQSDRQCDLSLLFENNLQSHVLISTEFSAPSGLVIYGENGRIEIPNFWKAQTAKIFQAEQIEEIEITHENEFVFEIEHVNDCLAKGFVESPVVSAEMTLQTVELVEKMYQQWTQS